MDNSRHIKALLDSIDDFDEGIITLGLLIQKIEGLIEIIGDKSLKELLFDDFLALDEVYAVTRVGEFNYDRDGAPVVQKAIGSMVQKIADYASIKN